MVRTHMLNLCHNFELISVTGHFNRDTACAVRAVWGPECGISCRGRSAGAAWDIVLT